MEEFSGRKDASVFLSVIRFLRKPFDYVCHDDGSDAPIREKLAEWFAWFASGTDCRCCIGMRIPFAFVCGVVVGLWLV